MSTHDQPDHSTHPHHEAESITTSPRQLTTAENRLREIRTKAIESILLEKGLVTHDSLDAVLNAYENDIGPLNGAQVVARAWVDPAYKGRLLNDGTAAIAELGFGGLQGEHLVVVENTPSIHNVVACVLCSCYPWPVLGYHRSGTKIPPIARALVANRVTCFVSLVWR
jgi:nitrile hydratase subunit alpha